MLICEWTKFRVCYAHYQTFLSTTDLPLFSYFGLSIWALNAISISVYTSIFDNVFLKQRFVSSLPILGWQKTQPKKKHGVANKSHET
jgi:hypothetical protein